MCKQLAFIRVTSLKAVESLDMIETCYHLSGNLHWLDSGVSGVSTRLPFPRTFPRTSFDSHLYKDNLSSTAPLYTS